MTDPTADLDDLITSLETAAARLRAGELEAGEAAELVDECARLAARATAALDRESRAGDALPGQDALL